MSGVPWYRSWFGEGYLYLYPHRDMDEADRAVRLLMDRAALSPDSRVLDLACGGGRHLAALEGHGVRAVGLDLSSALLKRARQKVQEAELVRGDMRNLPFADGVFAAVTSFFTSFGYFEDEGEDLQVLQEMRRVLEPGGTLLLDFLNADRVRAGLTPRDERIVDGHTVIQKRRLTDGGRVVEKHIHVKGIGDEADREFLERVRLYDPDELEEMVETSGMRVEARMGGYDGVAWSGETPRVILLARGD